MYPHERSLVKQLADKPFALIGVNSDGDDLEKIHKILEEKNLTWRSFQNDSSTGTISDAWGIRGWPTVFIIDAEGVIRFKGHGGDFDSVIEECLAEIGHDVELVMDDPGEQKDLEEDSDEDDSDEEEDDSDDKESEDDGDSEDTDDDGR